VYDYAVSRNKTKSKYMRRYTLGGAGMGGSAERFGPPARAGLIFWFFWVSEGVL